MKNKNLDYLLLNLKSNFFREFPRLLVGLGAAAVIPSFVVHLVIFFIVLISVFLLNCI
jgi:hypothetical protein